ncbi:MAG TPA: rhodanese-like domain-containing protein [Sutterella sp.]|nr:rhodanese-like domain-containing protein [Sutterella sp.]
MHRRIFLASLALAPFSAPLATSVPSPFISPRLAKELMAKHPDTVLIDVRTPEEFRSERIPGAINLPVAEIVKGKLPAQLDDKNRLYFVYCRSGRRSALAVKLLQAQGFKNACNLGGILDWPYEIER